MANAATFATWNVQYGVHADAVAARCKALDVDVLALQEVDRRTRRVGGADVLTLVADATGLTPIDGAVRRLQGGTHGNALLVRGEVRSAERTRFPRAWWPLWRRPPPRGAIVATVDLPSVGDVTIVCCHLGPRYVDGSSQLRQLLFALGTTSPLVVLGDLNLRPAAVQPFADAHDFRLVKVPPTFPAPKPVATIDHVLVRGLRAVDVETRWSGVSDHRAVVAVLEVDYRRSSSPRA